MELSLLVFVWVAFLGLQIAKVCIYCNKIHYIDCLQPLTFIFVITEPYNYLFSSLLGIEPAAGKNIHLNYTLWYTFFILESIFFLNLQIPAAFSVSLYEAISLYKGRRVISSKGDQETHFRVHQLVFYCFCGVLAGIVGGLLGLGGGFIMGPLFLELGVPPQVPWYLPSHYMAYLVIHD